MLTAAIEGLVQRYQLSGERLGEVAAGAVMKHSRDFNLTRETVLGTSLDSSTPCFDIQQACGTGLQAINLVANKIALGQIDAAIAGGVDTTSDAPIGVSEGLRKILLQVNKARSFGERVKPFMQPAPKGYWYSDSGELRAAHRHVDGRSHRSDGQDLADSPRPAGRNRLSQPQKPGGRLRPAISLATWSVPSRRRTRQYPAS